MKKTICLLLAVLMLMLTACSKWKVEIVDPREPIEIEQETVSEPKANAERYIKGVSAEKIETSALTEGGFGYGVGSGVPFCPIDETKGLFFSYRIEDPLAGTECEIRVFVCDFADNSLNLLEEFSFAETPGVLAYSKGEETKIVFQNKLFSTVVSVNTETFETKKQESDSMNRRISPVGTYADMSEGFLKIRDIENPDNSSIVTKIDDDYNFESWSPKGKALLFEKGFSDEKFLLVNTENGNATEFSANGIKKWCAEEGFLAITDYDSEEEKSTAKIINSKTGEIFETEFIENAVLYEKEFSAFTENKRICIKENSTGKIFRTEEIIPEFFYGTAEIFDLKSGSFLLLAPDDKAEFYSVKIDWEKKAYPEEEIPVYKTEENIFRSPEELAKYMKNSIDLAEYVTDADEKVTLWVPKNLPEKYVLETISLSGNYVIYNYKNRENPAEFFRLEWSFKSTDGEKLLLNSLNFNSAKIEERQGYYFEPVYSAESGEQTGWKVLWAEGKACLTAVLSEELFEELKNGTDFAKEEKFG